MKKLIPNFLSTYKREIDNRLNTLYTEAIPAEFYYDLFEYIEMRHSYSKDAARVGFFAKTLDKRYGTVKINGKRTHRYLILLNNLIDAGILLTDNSYKVKSAGKSAWSKSYRISNNFYDSLTDIALIETTSIYSNDINFYERVKKSSKHFLSSPKGRQMKQQLNKLELDTPAAMNWIETLLTDNKTSNKKIAIYVRYIKDILKKDWSFSISPNVNRYFTTFNMIKSELREFFTVDGEKLVSADLKSAQPYFLASYLNDAFPTDDNIKQFYHDTTTSDIYTMMLNEFLSNRPDGKYFGFKGEQTILTRTDVKIAFLTVMFKPNKGGAAILHEFSKLYPAVYEAMKRIKHKQHNALSIKLQIIESTIFIGAYRELSDLGIWVTPVHDSLYVKASDKEIMLSVLNKHFALNGYKNYTLN